MINIMNSDLALRSQRTNVFLAKFWGPTLCIVATIGIFSKDFLSWRILFASPLIIAALFGASLATLELRGGILRYRRLFRWTTISNSEITASGVVWQPFIGFLSLDRFILPWGRIYFVLDQNTNLNPFRRGDYPILRYLKKEPVPSGTEPAEPIGVKDRSLKLNLLIAGAVGAIFSSFLHVVIPSRTPGFPLEQPLAPNTPLIITLPARVFHMLNTPPMLTILLAIFILLAMFRYGRKDAWIFAFLAGVSFTYVMIHWM
jgi:hypothetical protein